MELGIAGKTALITGGSRGLGYACAVAFAREGVRTGLVGRNVENLEQAARTIREETGADVLTLPGDVTDPSLAPRAVAQLTAAFGGVDILLNNASPRVWGLRFDEVTDDIWIKFWREKVMAYAAFARAVTPGMKERRWGRIVNMSGMGGRNPSMRALPGGMAQTAVLNLTKATSDEFGPFGITVNAVAPGAIFTGAQEDAGPKGSIYAVMAAEQGISEETAKQRFLAGISLQRHGTAEEVADLVVFLASDRASYITGTNVTIDGGRSKSIV